MAGTAREEAERLVATVLAMAASGGSGPGRSEDDDSLSGTAKRITEGLGTLGETLMGALGHLTDPSARRDPADAAAASGGGATAGGSASGEPAPSEPASSEPAAGGATGGAAGGMPPGGGSAGDPWAAATAQDSPGAAASSGAPEWSSGDSGSSGVSELDQLWARGWAKAGRSHGVGWATAGWATGSAECCVCPICRVIAGLRDPTPETAERLATGAGDFATGVASLMRAFSAMTNNPRPAKPARPARPADPDTAWSAATRTSTAAGRHERAAESDDLDESGDDSPWAAATHASNREARANEEAARAARQEAREAAEAARRAERAATAAATRQAHHEAGPESPARRPTGDVWAAATHERPAAQEPTAAHEPSAIDEPPAESTAPPGTDPAVSAPCDAGGIQPRTPASGPGPRTKDGLESGLGDGPAAGDESGVARAGSVDHDVAGPSGENEPGASAAEGPAGDDADGDDARGGGA
jgi:hypothetical protein